MGHRLPRPRCREPLAPPWRELVRHYRRLEARGEIRGGRFLAGVGGEQFAVPEAVEVARTIRRLRPSGVRIEVAGVDPLNLTGIVTPGRAFPLCLGRRSSTWTVFQLSAESVDVDWQSPRSRPERISGSREMLRRPGAPKVPNTSFTSSPALWPESC
jgi:hypothetical protein